MPTQRPTILGKLLKTPVVSIPRTSQSFQMTLADLKVGGLYVMLQALQEPPEPNEFNWGLYLHSDSMGGMAYRVVDTGCGLRSEHEYTGGIFNSPLLTGLFRIADITRPLHAFVDRVIRSYDSSLNCPGRSGNSKFWVLNVLALLIQPTATGWLPVNCHNLPVLEQEIRDWGNRMSQGRHYYPQLKPVGSSTICGLPEWKTQPMVAQEVAPVDWQGGYPESGSGGHTWDVLLNVDEPGEHRQVGAIESEKHDMLYRLAKE